MALEKINRLAYFQLGDMYDARHPRNEKEDGEDGENRMDASKQVDTAELGREGIDDAEH